MFDFGSTASTPSTSARAIAPLTEVQPILFNTDVVKAVAAANEQHAANAAATATKHAKLATAADAFAALLAGRTKITWPSASEIMTETLGGSDAEGAWTAQDLYNVVESGLVRAVLEAGLPSNPNEAITFLSELDALLITRRRRSDEGILLQQFSTPIPYAYLASLAAGITEADLVLEPSAGTGILALFGRLAGGRVAVNEIDQDRLSLLSVLDPLTATDHDPRYLSALYRGEQPSVVLMNPPFSIDHNLGAERRVRALALSHVEQAVRVMRRGGRLVAIVGHSQHPAENRDACSSILERATIRAAFAIDPNVYKHMGTTFGTAMVVLDATIDSERPHLHTATLSLSDALAALAEIPSRIRTGAATRHAGGQVVSIAELRTRTEIVDAFAFREKPEPVSYRPRTEIERVSEDGRYASYAPQSIVIEGAKPHPTPLVESAALAYVRPPVPTYVPHLMPSLVRDGVLSDAQLEAIIYAGEAHSKEFELVETDEESISRSVMVRRGWMSGYGTGFGKGRTNAAIVAAAGAAARRQTRGMTSSK